MNGALGREGSYGSPKDGFPDEVRLFAGRKNKSLPGRDLGGGKSCRQRGEHGQRSGRFLENGDWIGNRCLMRLGAAGGRNLGPASEGRREGASILRKL